MKRVSKNTKFAALTAAVLIGAAAITLPFIGGRSVLNVPPPAPVPPPPVTSFAGHVWQSDINNDKRVDGADLSVLQANFGKKVEKNTGGDVNGDGVVNTADLSVMNAELNKPLPTITRHPTQAYLAGKDGFFFDVSAYHRSRQGGARSNPRGWFDTRVEELGFVQTVGPVVDQAAAHGYKAFFLWEPTGYPEETPLWDKSCMATFTERTMDSWTPLMRYTFPELIEYIKNKGMEPVIYSGCGSMPNSGSTLEPRTENREFTEADFHLWDATMDAAKSVGVRVVFFDALSWTMYVQPEFTRKLLVHLHQKYPDMAIGTEGWYPRPGSVSNWHRQVFMHHTIGMELVDPKPGNGVNDIRLSYVNPDEEKLLVSDRLGYFLFHYSGWTDPTISDVAKIVRGKDCMVLSYLTPRP